MKTPEQMADAFIDLCNDDDRVIAKASFLAGYQAAKDQLADADKVINGNTSDGYHTFNELYEHRHYLFIALMYALQTQGRTWISSKHADQSSFDGSFIAGINLPTGPITYHLPNRLWIACVGAETKVLIQAPPWDGHTSTDVLNRLARYSAGICDEVAPPFVDKVINFSNNLNGWISVKERLPEDISDVLILSKEKKSCVGYYRSSDNDWNMYNPCCSFHMELHGITHWQPLPAAPKEEA